MSRFIDLTGQQFGEWKVLQKSPKSLPSRTLWTCRCSCGSVSDVLACNLRSGGSRRCAHHDPNLPGTTRKSHPLYTVWLSMKQRCGDTNCKSYKFYGGRGVSVCPEWAESFGAFVRDMGPRPDGMSLDRIDPHGNYEPKNCRWATAAQQYNNKRDSIRVTYEGKEFTLKQLAAHCGVKYLKLFNQHRTQGRPLDEALARARQLSGNTTGLHLDKFRRAT